MKKIILMMTCLLISTPMFAGTFSCSVNVDKVLLYKQGFVNIRHAGRNNFTYICNLNEEWKGVSVTTCAMWVGLLQDVKKRNSKATFFYNTNDATSCADLPTYGNAPSPVYISEY